MLFARTFAFALLSLVAIAATLEERATPTCTISLKTPAPSGFVCGAAGSINAPAPIKTTTATTQVVCRDSCLNNLGQCVSFSYNSQNQRCITYSKKILQSTFKKNAKSPTVFWNHYCYKRVCKVCPQQYPTKCSGECVNTKADTSNCNACGNMCADGASCSSGKCICPSNTTVCNGACMSLMSNDSNCGKCGTKCLGGMTCQNGSCKCPSGFVNCGGSCVNTATSKTNCGGCGQACDASASCSASQCTCPAGQGLCSGPFGACQNTNSTSNCGTCGNQCVGSEICSSGQCLCPQNGSTLAGQASCKGNCTVDYVTDPSNCGACGTSCSRFQRCVQGNCTIQTGYLYAYAPGSYVDGFAVLTSSNYSNGVYVQMVTGDHNRGFQQNPFVFDSNAGKPYFLYNGDSTKPITMNPATPCCNDPGSSLEAFPGDNDKAPVSCSYTTISASEKELNCSIVFGDTVYNRFLSSYDDVVFTIFLVTSQHDPSDNDLIRLISRS